MVATYSSILDEHDTLKQLEHKQSTTSDGVKIGGKSLHQHLLPSGVSPQLNGAPQAEQFFTRIVLGKITVISLLFQQYEKANICVLICLELQKVLDEKALPTTQSHLQQLYWVG